MHKLIWLLLFPVYVLGVDNNASYAPMILSLNSEHPIEMNQENKAHAAKEQQDVEQIFHLKRFPWEYVLGPLLFALLFLISRQQPEKAEDRLEKLKKRRLMSKNRALDSLKELSGESLPQAKQFDTYYEKITFIVRKYIEEYYLINASTETTEEFLQNISGHPIFDKNTEASLAKFLESADRVKFSEHTPTLEECAKAQNTAEKFIHK